MKRFLKNSTALATLFAFMVLATLTQAADKKDIVDTAVSAGSFNTLAAALGAADLVEALKGEGPFTVLAPTDAAFKKLPAGTVEALLKPENKDKLAAILKYHVVPGRVYSEDALAAGKAKTLQGGSVHIKIQDGEAKVNKAKILATDIDASNGVIHVIDTVIMPSDDKKFTATDARHKIKQAVANGVQLYNSGHHGACAKVYMKTMSEMLDYGDQMPKSIRDRFEHAMTNAKHESCPTQQAWALRKALDHAYLSMSNL